MMTDLTPMIEHASQSSEVWDVESVRSTLSVLAEACDDCQTDWEADDEDWARILQSSKVVALVSAKLPLVFVSSTLEQAAKHWAAERNGAVFIVNDDFDVSDFTVERSLLERVFSRTVSPNVDYDNLSINDLWWATV